MSFTLSNPICLQRFPFNSLNSSTVDNSSAKFVVEKRGRGNVGKVNALPDYPLMAVLVQHMEGQRDLITHKSIWHLSDQAIKNVCKYLT
ncbi:Photosynthetic NDH subunit of subcomplex B 4 chloroplastic [Bienertia sinuspersici]